MDTTDNTLNYKVRSAQLSQHNIILVVGEKEKEGAYFDLRLLDGTRIGPRTMPELLE